MITRFLELDPLQRINIRHLRLPMFYLCGARLVLILASILLAACSITGCGGNSMGKSGNSQTPPVTPPSNLIYAMPEISGAVGVPISPDTDTVAGSIATFTVNPAMPPGLTLNPATGTISGTPTATADGNYTITATNSAGSTTAGLVILVVLYAPSNLSYSEPDINDTVGTAIQPDTPTVTGMVGGFSIQPALPAGLALDPSTGIISGTPTAYSPETVYTVTAENPSGSATAQVTILVSTKETVLLEQGHGNGIIAIRATAANVLSEDTNGHWVLWNYVSGAIVASGDGAGTKDGNQIDLAGQLAAVATAQQVQVYSATDGHAVLTIPAPSWWKLATDGSYICAGTSKSLTAWSSTGDEAFSLTGDYHAAIAFAAPGQVQLSGGPSGQNVIETDTLPSGSSTISPQFAGTFNAWFLDGQRFLTNVGNIVWVYSSGATQQALVTLPSVTNLTGQGNWIWSSAGLMLGIYLIGSATPTQVFMLSGDPTSFIASGNTIGIFEPDVAEVSVVDLSGSTPQLASLQLPPSLRPNSYAAASASEWILGDQNGVLLDGTSLATTPRYFGYGAVNDIVASSNMAIASTAIGKVLIFNPATAAQTGAIDFFADELGLSTDGTVLGALASLRTALNLYSLPSTVPSQSFTYTLPGLLNFSLSGSGSGIVLGQVQAEDSVINIESGSTIWSDTGYGTPILLSPDGTLIATTTTGIQATDLITTIYLNGTLVSATTGTGEGWIDNAHLLVGNYVGGGQGSGPEYTGSEIVNSSGIVVSTIPGTILPAINAPQFPAPDRVYDAQTNSIYSLVTGEVLWQGPPVPQSAPNTNLGAVAGSMVVFETGHQIVAAPGP
jgi:hypothetical protein